MTERSPQFDCREVSTQRSLDDDRVLKIIVHVPLAPHRIVGWRMRADAQLRAHGSQIWLTREGRLDDYWLRMGDVVNLKRGERVWLSVDGGAEAHVTFTIQCVDRRAGLRRWLSRMQARLFGGLPIGV
jgi:hypothetical protein